jgi:anaerobic magnesium-protoporphyrin IX monomethyl ester cyclase
MNEHESLRDCLIVGFHDSSFPDFVNMMKGMGQGTGAFRDLNLAFVELDGRPLRCLDLANHLLSRVGLAPDTPYENCDFIWPVVLYLGSFLSRRGFSFDYINLFHREARTLNSRLREKRYSAIVITTTVYVSPHPIIEIVQRVRDAGVEAPIVIGGPYISNQYKILSTEDLRLLFEYLGGDIYVVSAEGESTLVKVLQQLKIGGDLSAIPNIAVRGESGFVCHPLETERNELQDEPIDYALFGSKAIGEFVSLRTAKSCPFACSFCGFPQRAGKYVFSDLGHVEHELDAIARLGTVSTLTFLDDTFNVPKGRFKSILRLMIDRGYGFRWNSFYRCDHGDDETIELMAESGCEGVFLGIESGCDRILELMNKSARKKHYAAALKKFREVGTATFGSFIVGFPGETRESVRETSEFIEEHAPTYYRAQLFYLDPATPVWRDREKFGITGGGFEWQHRTMHNREASTLIEQMFLKIRNSTWMPQHGFEDWSTYYLQRHGFTREEVVAWMAGFNELVSKKFGSSVNLGSQAAVVDRLTQIVVTARKRFLQQSSGSMGPIRRLPPESKANALRAD